MVKILVKTVILIRRPGKNTTAMKVILKFVLCALFFAYVSSEMYPVKGNNLLGVGLDTLTYEPKMSVFEMTYRNNKLDVDNKGYLPDDVVEYNQPEAVENFFGEVVSWKQNTSDSIKVSVEGEAKFWEIDGSFSAEYEWKHQHMANKFNKVVRTRASIMSSSSTLQFDKLNLTDGFRQQVLNIANSQMHNTQASYDRAIWEANLLLKKYGSSVITKVDHGGDIEMLVSNNINEWQDVTDKKLVTSASAHFAKVFSIKTTVAIDNTNYQKYSNSIDDLRVITRGGDTWIDGQNFSDWVSSVSRNPYPIKIYGASIMDFISPRWFPEMSMIQIESTRHIVKNSIDKYVMNNLRKGCMDPKASNFNYEANLHDEAACKFNRQFSFGGVYQSSACSEFQIKNELTQDFKCPTNFTAYPILKSYSLTYSWVANNRRCHSCWGVATCCNGHNQQYSRECTVTSHMCVAKLDSKSTKGSAFGGMFTESTRNEVVGERMCPTGFQTVKFPLSWDGSKYFAVCLVSFDSSAADSGVSFAGIFSSDYNNPEVDGHFCPQGYERHSLTISNGKTIFYCIGINDIYGDSSYKQPGYGDPEPPFVDSYYIGNDTYLAVNVLSPLSYEKQYRLLLNEVLPAEEQNEEVYTEERDIEEKHHTTQTQSLRNLLISVLIIGLLTLMGLIALLACIFIKRQQFQRHNNLTYDKL